MAAHRVRRSLPFARDQLFDLAADVERYPEFVPWWVAARVRKRKDNIYYTDQIIRFGLVSGRFGSKTVLHRPERIDVTASDGPIRDLRLTWQFHPEPGTGCLVSLTVELDLHPPLIRDLFDDTVTASVGRVMAAFEDRAHCLYGAGSDSALAADAPASRNTVF